MFQSNEFSDELRALKHEVARLLNETAEGLFEASSERADALADQVKAALDELGETLSEQEDHVGRIIADRPMTALASAFALGVVIGLMLRRH